MKNKSKYLVAIFGAQPDTPNMGVSALFFSLALSLYEKFSGNVEFIVFDNGLGCRKDCITINDHKINIIKFGARAGYRYYRPENLFTIAILSCLGRLGAMLNKGLTLLDQCDAVIDVSGGDSFSDIYGLKRFQSVLWPKIITINRKIPLILAPQTYGPYYKNKVKLKASEAVIGASICWARDKDSFEVLKDLLGSNFNHHKHFCGVDMAFLLPTESPDKLLDEKLVDWLYESYEPVIGINVSGLIYNDIDSSIKNYGFISNYKFVVIEFINLLLSKKKCKIVLVPHVMAKIDEYESDLAACYDLLHSINNKNLKNIVISPTNLNQFQLKGLISKFDWFCGTRMHATIAALSSGIPTASISYSDKTLGVFKSCGQDSQVFDPRVLSDNQIVQGLITSFENRVSIGDSLKNFLPEVLKAADDQMDKISNEIKSLKGKHEVNCRSS